MISIALCLFWGFLILTALSVCKAAGRESNFYGTLTAETSSVAGSLTSGSCRVAPNERGRSLCDNAPRTGLAINGGSTPSRGANFDLWDRILNVEIKNPSSFNLEPVAFYHQPTQAPAPSHRWGLARLFRNRLRDLRCLAQGILGDRLDALRNSPSAPRLGRKQPSTIPSCIHAIDDRCKEAGRLNRGVTLVGRVDTRIDGRIAEIEYRPHGGSHTPASQSISAFLPKNLARGKSKHTSDRGRSSHDASPGLSSRDMAQSRRRILARLLAVNAGIRRIA